ncbi:hypothetical protein QFC24_002011 [Naganishia onofrii]|uniref:Uncharacterized protein n=1 Tax=Naganishia onofrii TaxID=1851511 RepID=A0ACC2XQI2_9TREE|nr:hypothetical protein QFC24_002011 [Naganishia onofrii]
MYWPVGHVRALRTDHLTSENEPLIDFRLNRRTNLFITWTSGAITLWSSEPTCRISRLNRTQGSLEEYGLNRSVEWTADGHALYVSTTTNHILLYDLLETESPEAVASSLFSTQVPKINIDVPHILKSFPPGAGQGEVYDMTPEAIMTSTNIPELQLRNGGAVRLSSDIRGIAAIGGTSLPTAKKGLLIAIDHRGHPTDDETSGAPPFKGLLRLPSKIPEALVRKGSRSQPLPPYGWPYVDMDGEDQVDIDKWTWKEVGIDLAGHEDIAQFQATKMTLVYTVITTLGNAFLVFPSAPQQDDQPWWNKKMPVNRNSSWNSVQVHSVNLESTDEAKADNATAIGVNQPFGLCTVGTSR